MTDKRIYQIGLTMINGVGDILARHLLQALGEAEAVFTEKQQLLGRIPGIGSNIAAEIKRPEILQRAEKELAFIEKNNISCYYLTDTDYPVRLRECPDTPILFYFKGNTDLDATRIISIVGTRNATKWPGAYRIPYKRLGKSDPGLVGREWIGLRHRYLCPPERLVQPTSDCCCAGAWLGSYLSFLPSEYGCRNAGIGRSVDRFSQRHRTRPSKFPPAEPDCRRNLGLYDRG